MGTDGLDRALHWDGLVNGRDLGGLATVHGSIAPRRLVRSASVHTLTASGWRDLLDHGITSVIDIRHQWEVDEAPGPPEVPKGAVHRAHVPLEPPGYVDDWAHRPDRWKLGTPLFYHEFMAEHSLRVGTVLRAIVDAPAGGVLLHCHGGKDRAGLVTAILLDLLGTDHDTIAADHWISFDRRRSIEAELGKAELPGKPPPDREAYAAVVHDVLTTYPASVCFAETSAALDTQKALADRLCTASGTPGPIE